MSLSPYQMVMSLENMTIFRIQRTIIYNDSRSVSFYTTLNFQNTTQMPLCVAPVEMYKKNVLVNFETTNNAGERCIFVPSLINDEIIMKYVFFKLWTNSGDIPGMHKWLLDAFVNPEVNSEHLLKDSIETILNIEHKGTWSEYFTRAMWKPTPSSYTFKTLLNKIDLFDVPFFRKAKLLFPPLDLRSLFSEDLRHFLLNLDDHFLQLVYLPSEYDGFTPYQLSSSINLIAKPRKSCLSRYFSSSIHLWLNPLLINEKLPSFHLQIHPPEGTKFVFYKKKEDKTKASKLSRQFFSISHPRSYDTQEMETESTYSCKKMLQRLGLEENDSLIVPANSNENWNKLYRFSKDCIFLYFKSTLRTSRSAPCVRDHYAKLSFSIDNDLIFCLYWFFIFLTFVTLTIGGFVYLDYFKTGNIESLNLFSSFIIFVIGYGIGIAIDYTSRKEAQRFILRPLLVLLIVSTLFLSIELLLCICSVLSVSFIVPLIVLLVELLFYIILFFKFCTN